MIEYILLFSLGFLCATLVVLLVAPAVRRRVVYFTEKRIKATISLSSQELRAHSDMVQAVYAAENAKLSQAVRREREKGVSSEVKAERLWGELKSERSEKAALAERNGILEQESEFLKSKVAAGEAELAAVKAELAEKEAALKAGEKRIQEFMLEADHLGGLIDTGKIDLAVRETEIENLRAMHNTLKGERDQIREDLRHSEERASQAETRLTFDHDKIERLQARLNDELAFEPETDGNDEPQAADDLDENMKAVPAASFEVARAKREAGKTSSSADKQSDGIPSEVVVIDQGHLAETIRNDASHVSDVLEGRAVNGSDDALRSEIASIAARMVALTASREGASSSLYKILDEEKDETPQKRVSLAQRAGRVLTGKDA